MRLLLVLPAFVLAACTGACTNEPLPTPGSVELPNPEQVIIPAPDTLPTADLCAYDAKVTAAAIEWRAYIEAWADVLGYEPGDYMAKLDKLATEDERVERLLKARKAACPAPVMQP